MDPNVILVSIVSLLVGFLVTSVWKDNRFSNALTELKTKVDILVSKSDKTDELETKVTRVCTEVSDVKDRLNRLERVKNN